jgi:uncharacterized protein YybS (DUF2232 family)
MTVYNIIGCTISVIFVLFISAWIPFFGPFFSLLTPLPFLFYSSKLGLNQGIKIGLVSLLFVGIVAKIIGYPQLVLFCLEFGMVGLIISEIFRREYSFSLTIFWGTILMLFIGSGFLFFIGLSKGLSPVEMILNYLQSNLDKTIGLYEKEGLNQAMVTQLRQLGPVLVDLVKKTYPSLIIVGAGFVVWLNVVLSKPLFIFNGVKYPDLGKADMWKAPEYLVWGLIAAGFSLLSSIKYVNFVALNSLIIFSVIYAFHGFSILIFFFNKYNVPTWIRAVVYIIIIFQQLFLIILALMGLFDQWIDFRKINKIESESG